MVVQGFSIIFIFKIDRKFRTRFELKVLIGEIGSAWGLSMEVHLRNDVLLRAKLSAETPRKTSANPDRQNWDSVFNSPVSKPAKEVAHAILHI